MTIEEQLANPMLTPAEIAATRRLIGLSPEQLAAIMNIGDRSVRRWETGAKIISDSAANALLDLRQEHDEDTKALATAEHIEIPAGTDLKPSSWWLAAAARIIDRNPEATINWHSDGTTRTH